MLRALYGSGTMNSHLVLTEYPNRVSRIWPAASSSFWSGDRGLGALRRGRPFLALLVRLTLHPYCRLLNTTRSDTTKFTSEQIAIVARFALSNPMLRAPASRGIRSMLPASETKPVVKLNLNRYRTASTNLAGERPPRLRSAHVQPRCQMKLWIIAISTASAVATTIGSLITRTSRVSADN